MPVETRFKGDKAVQKVTLIKLSTSEPDICYYRAWEKDSRGLLETEFRSITHIDDVRYGQIGTDDRSRGDEALSLINEMFPETISGKWDATMQEVSIYG